MCLANLGLDCVDRRQEGPFCYRCPDSDLDVAVLSDTADSRARRYLQADLAVALAHLAPEGRVDVILLDEAPVDLRQAIMESGRVLLDRDPEAWKELRVRTMREYGDSEYYR